MLTEHGLDFMINKPVEDEDSIEKWWSELSLDERRQYLQFQSFKGPNREKIISRKIQSKFFR